MPTFPDIYVILFFGAITTFPEGINIKLSCELSYVISGSDPITNAFNVT